MSHFFATRIPLYVLKRRVDVALWNALAKPTPLNITNLDVAEEERDAYIQAMWDRAIQRTVLLIKEQAFQARMREWGQGLINTLGDSSD
jgi:hypothetical protein